MCPECGCYVGAAAEIDGANRWQKIWYVTIPGIVPTIATLFILNAGMFLSADLNQVINFSNDVVRTKIDIIDTYVYRSHPQNPANTRWPPPPGSSRRCSAC